MQIRPVSQVVPYIKALVFGPPGSGKTTFAASGHNTEGLSPTLFLYLEEGILSANHTTADVTSRITHKKEVDTILHNLAHGIGDFKKYKTVVIDTGTRLQQIVLEDCIEKTIAAKGQDRTIDDVYYGDWNGTGKAMRRLVSGFVALDKHVIITAHSRELSPPGPEGASPRPATDIVPDFTPTISRSLRGYMNYVWYMQASRGDYYLLTSPAPPKEDQKESIIRTKTHGQKFSKLLGHVIKNPNLPDIYAKLQESRKQ